MNKKIIWGIVALIVLILIVVLYEKKEVKQGVEETIKVGVLLPLSENFAWWGDAIKNSIDLAQVNGYAKNFEFIYQDTKCSTKDAVSGTQALRALHPTMHIYIVGCDSDLKAMTALLSKENDLSFMVGLSGADLYETNFPIINLAHRLESEAAATAQFASEKLGVKNIGIITDNGTFGATLASTSAKYIEDRGGKAVAEKIKYNESNPETSILKIILSKPDAIYMQNDIPALSAILKRLNQLGYKGNKILYYGGRDQSLIDTAGQAAEGVYVPWVISDESNESRQRFEESFKTTNKKDPFVTSYFTYDGIMLLDEATRSCGGKIRCIEDYFYKKDNFVGTLGHVRYQPGGQVERTFYFQQVKDGKFVDVK